MGDGNCGGEGTLTQTLPAVVPYHYVQHRRQSHLLHILRSTFEEIETVYDLAIGILSDRAL